MFKTMMHVWTGIMMAGLAGIALAGTPPVAASRFVIQGDTVLDKKTNLTWARCSIGQRWKNGAGCTGTVDLFTFDDAQQQGGSGWRIPTKDELASLVDYARVANNQRPAIDEVTFPNLDRKKLEYWSSTPSGAAYGWPVNFYSGDTYYAYTRGNTFAVRLLQE
ncbi:MAG: DUF1566 domain-containing protein [Nitrosomonadales bacterium]|nr:DUF1566 domain-containing protein [Nitrosomonadales bacterium]